MTTSACPEASVRLADRAHSALVAEAELTPKPGLVDRRGPGAHSDMDLALLIRSADVLRPWFAAMARSARRHDGPTPQLRAELGALGRAAEIDMLAATSGVNTHRGAIWALGLLTASAAQQPEAGPRGWGRRAGVLARLPDPGGRAAPGGSNGMRARLAYGAKGARGEAEAGFPHVVDVGLHALRASRRRGADEESAQLDALLALMAAVDDTCVLHRGGIGGLRLVQVCAALVLEAGGATTGSGRAALSEMDVRLRARNLSPGGCADLLAATLFLDALTEA